MTAKTPEPVDDGGGAVVVDGRNYIPVDPPSRPWLSQPGEDLADDEDSQEPAPKPTGDGRKASDSTEDGKPARASAQQARMIPGKPLLTILGGSFGTFLPIVAQATTARDLLIIGGGTALAGGTGLAAKAAKGRKARRNGNARGRGTGAAGTGPAGRGRGGDRSGRRRQQGNGVLSGARSTGTPGGRTAGRGSGVGSKLASMLKPGAGGPGGSGRLAKALNRKRTAAAGSGPAATSGSKSKKPKSQKHAAPRTRTGRAASAALRGTGRGLGAVGRGLGRATRATARTARRASMSPFWAAGQGVKGARKGGSWTDAARRARKQAMKHRKANGRNHHPFAGWGAAFAGGLGYGAIHAGRLLRNMGKWTRSKLSQRGMYDANGEPAARIIGDKVRPDPDAATKTTAQTAGPAQAPIVIAPSPVQPIGTRTAHHSRPGGTTMTDSSLVLHAQAMQNEAERRANVGARPGILEVVDDSKRFGVALHHVEQALKAEVQAVNRFPFHPAVKAAYDAALDALHNAGQVMTQCAVSIEDIHRDELEQLRNPSHENAQMWDHTMNNGARGGA